jgi:ADP-ribosylglycohydrolase
LSITSAVEAFAVGDALGMVPEFMTAEEIKQKFGLVDRLLDPHQSRWHKALKKGQVTDDTEQLFYCMAEYKEQGINCEATARALTRWYREREPEKQGFIGRSSKAAIQYLMAGEDIEKAGLGGTTCGGAMRVAAAALLCKDDKELASTLYACIAPTHNTNLAMEGAFAFGYGVFRAFKGGDKAEIITAALKGGKEGSSMALTSFAGPSTASRIEVVCNFIRKTKKPQIIIDYLYKVIGTGMETYEVVPVVFGLFILYFNNPWQAIKTGASIGGDTDTIAAMAGMLTTLAKGSHNIPAEIVSEVARINGLDYGAQRFSS